MQRIIGVALVVVGVVLVAMGVNATDSFASQVSKFFTGSPTDRAIWLMILGAAAIVVGAGTILIPSRALDR